MTVGWIKDTLSSLFPAADADVYQEFDLPPIRIHPLGELQLMDLRALKVPEVALSAGLRVAVEMTRTLEPFEQRTWFFAPNVTFHIISKGGIQLAWHRELLRARLSGKGDTALLFEPSQLEVGGVFCADHGLIAVPSRGPGANDIEAKIGEPPAAGYVIAHPKDAPDLVAVQGVPGIGIRMDDEVLLDLRRLGGSWPAAVMAAKFALKAFGSYRTRTWIVADWQVSEELPSTAEVAADIVAEGNAEVDQLAVDGEITDPIRRLAAFLGLEICEQQRRVALGLSLPYPQLAHNIMLAHALTGK